MSIYGTLLFREVYEKLRCSTGCTGDVTVFFNSIFVEL